MRLCASSVPSPQVSQDVLTRAVVVGLINVIFLPGEAGVVGAS